MYRFSRQTHILFKILNEYWFPVRGIIGQCLHFANNNSTSTQSHFKYHFQPPTLFLLFLLVSCPFSAISWGFSSTKAVRHVNTILIRNQRKHKKTERTKSKRWLVKKSNNQVFYFTMRIAYPPKQILIFSLLRKAITTFRFRCKGLRLIELRLPVRLKAVSKQCIISDYYCCDNISQSGPI